MINFPYFCWQYWLVLLIVSVVGINFRIFCWLIIPTFLITLSTFPTSLKLKKKVINFNWLKKLRGVKNRQVKSRASGSVITISGDKIYHFVEFFFYANKRNKIGNLVYSTWLWNSYTFVRIAYSPYKSDWMHSEKGILDERIDSFADDSL